MLETGELTREQYEKVSISSLGLSPGRLYSAIREPYFFGYVRDKLIEVYGAETVRSGGLEVYTTIVPRYQRLAERAIRGTLNQPRDPREALAVHVTEQKRFKLAIAAQYAEPLKRYLEKIPGVRDVVVAGSYRRFRETVGDIDSLITATEASAAMDRFVAYDEVRDVSARGETRATVILKSGLQVDVRVVDPEGYGAALQYFTGSKAHNIEIRRRAQERKLKISEYGVFRGEKRIAGNTEESVYRAVGLPWIPPELRQDRGEVEAALANRLPDLVELRELRGDLQCHT